MTRNPRRFAPAIVPLVWLFATGDVWASGYTEAAVEGGGTLTGSVRFKGEPPAPEKRAINKDMEVCGEGHRTHHTVRVGEGGALADVVVFIDGVPEGKAWSPEIATPHLVQKDCAFTPYFQVVRPGDEITIENGDPVSHNIHSYEIVGRARISMFNIQQPGNTETEKKIRLRRGNVIRHECDQHDFMIGWMYAVENPYYAVVGEDGAFNLSDVPAGTHKVKAWHPYLGTQEVEITIAPGGSAEVSFEFE